MSTKFYDTFSQQWVPGNFGSSFIDRRAKPLEEPKGDPWAGAVASDNPTSPEIVFVPSSDPKDNARFAVNANCRMTIRWDGSSSCGVEVDASKKWLDEFKQNNPAESYTDFRFKLDGEEFEVSYEQLRDALRGIAKPYTLKDSSESLKRTLDMLTQTGLIADTAPKPDADGWITEWTDGVCPVEKGARVQFKFQQEIQSPVTNPECYRWNRGSHGSIVAYRRIPTQS